MIALAVVTAILALVCLIADMLTGTAFWQTDPTEGNTK